VTNTNSSVVKCQGISQCLESGHPADSVNHRLLIEAFTIKQETVVFSLSFVIVIFIIHLQAVDMSLI
jgi:hypothetical protein